eukprot:UN02911
MLNLIRSMLPLRRKMELITSCLAIEKLTRSFFPEHKFDDSQLLK